MVISSSRPASQLRDFIASNHIYADDINEETIHKIHQAAEMEPEENLQPSITKRKGKMRKSIMLQFPVKWSTSWEAFQRAVYKFESGAYSQSPGKLANVGPSQNTPRGSIPPINLKQGTPNTSSPMPNKISYRRDHSLPSFDELGLLVVPREVTSLFQNVDMLEENKWTAWKYHMKDNLEACNLWDIVTGVEKRPDEYYVDDVKLWVHHEKIVRIAIKNLFGPKDYLQVQHFKTVTEIWTPLMEFHQSTGALYKEELMWKLWGMRCSEGASVREHVGSVRALHAQLAEMAIFIENYLLAILTAKIEGSGSIIMQSMVNGRKKVFKLTNVLHVPTTRHCWLSGPRLDQSGGIAEYGNGKCRFWNAEGDLLTTGVLNGNLYRVDAKASVSQCPTVNQISIPALSWHGAHKRLGHVSLTSLKILLNNKLVESFGID
ncbi:hypothetical protein K3495_g6269 [Podosphaera aphanis]|nr:hypothetical protein K3495_g6269 [Podosphaera aphanis]